jgi:hypothetical protein
MTEKALSLIHLELGSKLFNSPDPSFTDLVSIYLAPASVLYQARQHPEVMEDFKKEAASMAYEEAGEIVHFFTQASFKFMKKSNPKMFQKMLEAELVEEV